MSEAELPERVHIAGVDFDAVDEQAVVRDVVQSLRLGRGGWIVTPNVDILRQIRRNPQYGAMVDRASLVVVDGAPVQWAGRVAGHSGVPRVPGSSVVGPLIEAAAAEGRPVLLLGGRPGASSRAADRLLAELPHLRVLEHCPPYGFESDDEAWAQVVAAVEAADGGVVLCGFGFPKQERLMAAMSVFYPRTWFLGVGGTIDFLGGEVRRAPAWVQRIGFEWVFRLLMEPRRLARRYLVDGLPFAARMLTWAAVQRLRRGARRTTRAVRPVDLDHRVAGVPPQALGSEARVADLPGASGPGDPHGASWAIQALRELCEPGVTPDVRADALDRLVDRLRRQGRYAECVGLLRERLTLPFDDPRREVIAQMQLARFLMESGAIHEAARTAMDAVARSERANLATTVEGVKLRVTLADMLRMSGDLIAADLQIGLALRAAQRDGDPVSLGSALWNAALISSSQGRHAESQELARAARDVFADLGDDLRVALVTLVEASTTLDSGTTDVAWLQQPLAEASGVIRELGGAGQRGVALTQVARLELRLGRAERALARIQQALDLLDESSVVDHASARSVEAQTRAALGQHDQALQLAIAAADELERIGATHLAYQAWADLAVVSPALAEVGVGEPAPVLPAPRQVKRRGAQIPQPRSKLQGRPTGAVLRVSGIGATGRSAGSPTRADQ